MGGGSWSSSDFTSYTARSKGVKVDKSGAIRTPLKTQEVFKNRRLSDDLNPRNIKDRECLNTEEHPNTLPVILALDVTGSMGPASVEVAKQLGVIMNDILQNHTISGYDVEFMIMAIGDLAYDDAPIQISQFESDVRIAEHLDKVYFEGGGGGNSYESYSAAWYMGSRHCKLDCLKQGRKGIIITMGDEPLNPYLPAGPLRDATGDKVQGDVGTKEIYEEASEKFDIYHIHVNDGSYDFSRTKSSYEKYLDERHLLCSDSKRIGQTITAIILNSTGATTPSKTDDTSTRTEVGW